MSNAVLSAVRVTKRFGGLAALRDVDVTIDPGEIVAIIGPNGAGKTTFFNIIAGIYDPTSGSVAINDRKMIARPIRAWAEPFVWVAPAIVLTLLTLGAFTVSPSENVALVGSMLVLGSLIVMLVSAVARP